MPCSLIFFAEYYGFPEAKIIFWKGYFLPFPMSYSFKQGFLKKDGCGCRGPVRWALAYRF